MHCLDISVIAELKTEKSGFQHKSLEAIAHRIISAKENNASVVFMMGAHVIRSGVQKYLIDLMKKGYISCVATNGAVMIHDFEFAMIGATTESVAKYIREGQFGLWEETGQLNDIINEAYREDKNSGMGESVGKHIESSNYPYKNISILAAAYRLNIPVTVCVGIGYDIMHQHPNCDGAAAGALSYNDFLKFAEVIRNLEGGVVTNFGSAVMAPEVFLKALSMARNVVHQNGKKINKFSVLVCDLHDLPSDFREEPSKNNPAYYYRPWKTMLVRTVADGGESFYVKGRHSETIPALWKSIKEADILE
ncbi:MAG: deoxyhypusine synthase family protein [Candidatus Omnitrophota bacterium]|nr:MAG: deoxyhypusine synthase family protein [Candidatus Omnitrophota bacterium]